MPRILIGEDDPGLGKVASLVLRRAGFDVDVAPNADALNVFLRAGQYDLVLLDVRLGSSDGLELMRLLRKSGLSIPIIGWSADGSSDEAPALAAGCNLFLSKPVRNLELLAAVRVLLEEFTLAN